MVMFADDFQGFERLLVRLVEGTAATATPRYAVSSV
jgi:hypothetical protein